MLKLIYMIITKFRATRVVKKLKKDGFNSACFMDNNIINVFGINADNEYVEKNIIVPDKVYFYLRDNWFKLYK